MMRRAVGYVEFDRTILVPECPCGSQHWSFHDRPAELPSRSWGFICHDCGTETVVDVVVTVGDRDDERKRSD